MDKWEGGREEKDELEGWRRRMNFKKKTKKSECMKELEENRRIRRMNEKKEEEDLLVEEKGWI